MATNLVIRIEGGREREFIIEGSVDALKQLSQSLNFHLEDGQSQSDKPQTIFSCEVLQFGEGMRETYLSFRVDDGALDQAKAARKNYFFQAFGCLAFLLIFALAIKGLASFADCMK